METLCPFCGSKGNSAGQIRRHKTCRLIRASTVCLQNGLLKFENKIYKNTTKQPIKQKSTGPIDLCLI